MIELLRLAVLSLKGKITGLEWIAIAGYTAIAVVMLLSFSWPDTLFGLAGILATVRYVMWKAEE